MNLIYECIIILISNYIILNFFENPDFVVLAPETLFFWPLQAQSIAVEAQTNAGLSERIATLEQEVARYKEDAGKAQAEVDRLLEILREMENEKNDKDRKINELERYKN